MSYEISLRRQNNAEAGLIPNGYRAGRQKPLLSNPERRRAASVMRLLCKPSFWKIGGYFTSEKKRVPVVI
jgi:hypothetical protein